MQDIIYANSQDTTTGYGIFDTSGTSIYAGGTSSTSMFRVFTPSLNSYAAWDSQYNSSGTYTFNSYTTSSTYSTSYYSYSGIIYVGEPEEVKLQRARENREILRLEKNALFRGTRLLESLLPQLEYDKFKETKALEVVTNDFLYKLRLGERVRRVNKISGKEEKLCIVPKKGSLPDIDKLIGFKLLIEADEEYFNKTANVLNW